MSTKDATVDLLPGQGKVSEDLSVILIKQRRRGRPSDSRIVEAVSELGESKAGGYLQRAVYTYIFAMHGSNLFGRACQHIHYQHYMLTRSNNLADTTEVATQTPWRVDPAQ